MMNLRYFYLMFLSFVLQGITLVGAQKKSSDFYQKQETATYLPPQNQAGMDTEEATTSTIKSARKSSSRYAGGSTSSASTGYTGAASSENLMSDIEKEKIQSYVQQNKKNARACKPEEPDNFQMIPGYNIGGMARPTKKAHIRFLQEQGVSLVVTLTPEKLNQKLFAGSSVANFHLPVEDNCAPTDEQVFTEFLTLADTEIAKGHKVVIHCKHGVGRTGTVLAAWLIHHENLHTDQAIKIVNRRLHNAQKSFLRDFYTEQQQSNTAPFELMNFEATEKAAPKKSMDVDVSADQIKPGAIGRKAANLVHLQENLVKAQQALDTQKLGYSVRVPSFVALSTQDAQKQLLTQNIDLQARWRSLKNTYLPENKSSGNKAMYTVLQACSKLCSRGGSLEELTEAIKSASSHKKEKRPSKTHTPIIKSHTKTPKSPLHKSARLPKEVCTFIQEAANKKLRLMVRSSGKEDSDEFSNAGGNESFANVSPTAAAVQKAINGVIASYVSPKSFMQRATAQDLDLFENPYTPVLIQHMVGETLNGAQDAAHVPVGCVVYTQEPFGNTPGVTLVQASFGHNEGVVNSTVATDSFWVDELGNVQAIVKKKPQRLVPTFDQKNYTLEFRPNSTELQTAPTLSHADVRAIKVVADTIHKLYGKPMDIELVFERHTKTIYLVQARPLHVVKTTRPQYIRDTKGLEFLRGTTVNPNDSSVVHITTHKQVIIAPTLNDALTIFNTPGFDTTSILAVIVQGDAEATSHATAIFRGAGKPIFVTQQMNTLQEWLKDQNLSLHLDVQREIITRGQAPTIATGWFTHPIPMKLSITKNKAETKHAFACTENNSGVSNENLIEILKEGNAQSAVAALGSIVHRITTATDIVKKNAQQADSATQVIAQNTLAELEILQEQINITAQNIATSGLTRAPRDIKRLYLIKSLEALLFQQESDQLVNALSYANIETRYKTRSAFVENTNTLLSKPLTTDKTLFRIAHVGYEVAMTPALATRWVAFVAAIANMNDTNKQMFKEMFATFEELGALACWINASFNQKSVARGTNVTKIFTQMIREYTNSASFLKQLKSINTLIDAINPEDWAIPAKFDTLLKEFEKNILQFFVSDDLVKILSGKQNEAFNKTILLPLMGKLIALFDDNLIKTFKGSSQYIGLESQQVINFRRVVTIYFSILEKWSRLIENANPKCMALGYVIQTIPQYIQNMKTALANNTSNNPGEMLPSTDFCVASQTWPNYCKNTKFKLRAKNLEDFFTLTHQNINCIINHQMSSIGMNAIEKPKLFADVEKEVLKVTPPFTSNTMTLIGATFTNNSFSCTYNLPLKVHGETFEIIYNKKIDSVSLVVTIVTDDSREDLLAMVGAITQLSALSGIQLKHVPHIADNEIIFTLEITPKTNINGLKTHLEFINGMTYSKFKSDMQFSVVPKEMFKLLLAYTNEHKAATEELIRAYEVDPKKAPFMSQLVVRTLFASGKYKPTKRSASSTNSTQSNTGNLA